MIAYAKRLTASKFVRNVAIVASGTAGAQAITMAFSPIITRLYGPEAFGVLGTFTAILTVLTPLAALSYPIAIVLPKRDADALGLAKLSLGIALAMSLLAALILTLFKAPIVNAFNLEAVESFILLLPLAMLFSATMAVMSQWVIRKKLFKIKAKVAVLQALWLNTAKAGVGLFSPLAAVLVMLATVGSALHAFMLWVGVRKSLDGQHAQSDQAEVVIDMAKTLAWQYSDFAYYRTPQLLLNSLSHSLPVLLLANLYGTKTAGLYALARMALSLPSQLIGKSVSDVFFPRFVEALHEKKNGEEIIIKASAYLFFAGLLPYTLFFFIAPLLFGFVFGEDWVVSGHFSQWLAILSFSALIARPANAAIPAIGLQRFYLGFEIFSLISKFLALYAGHLVFSSPVATIAIFSLISAFLYTSLTFIVISKVRSHCV